MTPDDVHDVVFYVNILSQAFNGFDSALPVLPA